MRKLVFYAWVFAAPFPLIYGFAYFVDWHVMTAGKYSVATDFVNLLGRVFPNVNLSIQRAVSLVEAANTVSLLLFSLFWQALAGYTVWALFGMWLVRKWSKVTFAGDVISQETLHEEVDKIERELGDNALSAPRKTGLSLVSSEEKSEPTERTSDKRKREREEREIRKASEKSLKTKRSELTRVEGEYAKAKKGTTFTVFPDTEKQIAELKAEIETLEKELFPDGAISA